MKRILPIALVALAMSSCLYVAEPRVDHRDRVTGYYSVDEYSRTFNDHTVYSIRIGRSNARYDAVNIDNLYGIGLRVRAYVGRDWIDIPYQVIDGYEIEGSGTIHGSIIHLNYSVTDRYEWGPTDYLDSEALRE